MMKKLRVIVCGVVFGKYYIEGISRLSEQFELVGIVSTGSKRSCDIAEKYNVPLLTDVDSITKEQVDLACVVVKSSIVGGKGTELAVKFLEKGIHVIQEQPIYAEDYKKCLVVAKKAGCKYQLNTFYPNLHAVRKFLDVSSELQKNMPITYIKAESSVQVLFPMLAILNELLGGLSPYGIERLSGERTQRFAILNGEIKKVPLTFIIDNQMDVTAPESNLTMFHRLTIGTPKGTLMLTDTHGTVIWTPVFHEDLKTAIPGDVDSVADIPAQEDLFPDGVGKLGDIVWDKWPVCMMKSLTKMYKEIEEKKFITMENQKALTICQMWNEIGNLLGTYEQVDVPLERPDSLVHILEEKAFTKEVR